MWEVTVSEIQIHQQESLKGTHCTSSKRAAFHRFNSAQEFKCTVNSERQQEVQTALAHFLAGWPSSLCMT